MKKKALILFPFLDVAFKKEKGTVRSGQVPLIRSYWVQFYNQLRFALEDAKYEVHSIHDYMWALTPNRFNIDDWDFVYIPHKIAEQYGVRSPKAQYWMQSVFPHIFTIDHKGWGGSHSNYPFRLNDAYDHLPHFDNLQKRIAANLSKFEQPDQGVIERDFLFFPCQLPHDETIQFHSRWEVVEVLDAVCRYAELTNQDLIVKGHPVNPASMAPLKAVTDQYKKAKWVEHVSIHSCLKHAKQVFTLNSGVGFEAMLHERPVVTFAQSEYDVATQQMATLDPEKWVIHEQADVWKYRRFTNRFIEKFCVDVENPKTFSKFLDKMSD